MVNLRVTSILLFLYFLFMCCSYIYVTVYACSHVCGYTCGCIRSFKVDTGHLPQSLFILYAEVYKMNSSLNQDPAHFALRISCLCLLRAWIIGGHHICLQFVWLLGVWTPVLMFVWKVLYRLSHLFNLSNVLVGVHLIVLWTQPSKAVTWSTFFLRMTWRELLLSCSSWRYKKNYIQSGRFSQMLQTFFL